MAFRHVSTKGNPQEKFIDEFGRKEHNDKEAT